MTDARLEELGRSLTGGTVLDAATLATALTQRGELLEELRRLRGVVALWLEDAAHHEARAADPVVGFIEGEVVEAQASTLRRCARDVSGSV